MLAIIQHIEALKKKIDALRPIHRDLLVTIQEKLRIEWTYNSNALEGNTLTLGETAFFLREGLTSEGKPLKDYLEAKNHAEAIYGLEDIVHKKRKITEGLVKELHAVLLKDVEFTYARGAQETMIKKPLHPGQYKIRPNHVLTLSGTIHHYTDPLHVKDEMESLLKWYHAACDLHVVEKAAIFHYRFVAIHPFDDGNGRMARLLMNLILMQEGYPPCIVKNEHRRKYLEMLAAVDSGKQHEPFVAFIADELLAVEQSMVDVLYEKKETIMTKQFIPRAQRETLILETLERGTSSIKELQKLLPSIKRPTLKSDLVRLVKEGKIKKEGVKKGTVYFLL